MFGLASLVCGLASWAGFLIGARVVQSVGAALPRPATLSIISATFPPSEGGTAIGIWAGGLATDGVVRLAAQTFQLALFLPDLAFTRG